MTKRKKPQKTIEFVKRLTPESFAAHLPHRPGDLPDAAKWWISRWGMYEKYFQEGDRGLEVGTAEGRNARFLLATKPKELGLVDLWNTNPDYENYKIHKPEMIDTLVERMKIKGWNTVYEGVKNYFASRPEITLYRGYSTDVSSQFEDEAYDWVYIDAAHDYEGAMADIIAYSTKIKPDGYIAGHNYSPTEASGVEVKEVVDLLFKEVIYVDEVSTNWIAHKRDLDIPPYMKELWRTKQRPNG